MCGRYASFTTAQELADAFAIDQIIDDALHRPPSWNVAPTQDVRVILERAQRRPESAEPGPITRQLRCARWGLIPSWAKAPNRGAPLINARSETLDSKPSFKAALAARRCVVPADGWYEWTPQPAPARGKQPWYFANPDGEVLAFAGLYELWRDPALPREDPHRWVLSTTIVTMDTVDEHGHIHDRQPVLLTGDTVDRWLDPAITGHGEALELLRVDPPKITVRPASTAVNSVANDGPELLQHQPAG